MATADDSGFAGDFDPAAVKRSAIRVTGLIVLLLLIALLTPGLGTLRERIGEAHLGWLVVAIALEALSGFSYVLMLKPVFLRGQSWWMRSGWGGQSWRWARSCRAAGSPAWHSGRGSSDVPARTPR